MFSIQFIFQGNGDEVLCPPSHLAVWALVQDVAVGQDDTRFAPGDRPLPFVLVRRDDFLLAANPRLPEVMLEVVHVVEDVVLS